MLNKGVEIRGIKYGLIKFIRVYPVIVLGLLAIVYLSGGFDSPGESALPKPLLTALLYLTVILIPLMVITIFIVIGIVEDRERNRNRQSAANLKDEDPFEVAYEKMAGFKVVALTGETPSFTGITGDLYSHDDSARCTINPDHVPPAPNCECGFYAYKSQRDAQFELSIHPGLFLIAVDLFGIGYAHKFGYRAESQRVNSLSLPRRCMRCKTLPAKTFVKTYKLGYSDKSWWHWSIRCALCIRGVKEENTLTIDQMSEKLQVKIH